MANQFPVQRTAVASFTLQTVAATITSGVFIPAGALITGIHIGNDDAAVLTNATGTVVPKVGSVAIAATVNMSDLPAQTTGYSTAVLTNGMQITTGGELNLVLGTTNTSTASGTFDYYVDYLFIKD